MTRRRLDAAIALLALSVISFGCASPPEEERKAAESAVEAARAAEAEQYARSEFDAMMAAMKKAETEMSNKAYDEAKASYVAVKDLAEKAARAAEAGKAAAKAEAEKARAEAEQQLAELDARWKDLQAKAAEATRRLKADAKATWDASGKAIGEAFDSARAALASDARAAKERVSAIPAMLDKWEADLAALAAAAKKEEKKPAAKPAARTRR